MSLKNDVTGQQEGRYQCSLCGSRFPTESMTRAHMSFSEDSTHNVHSGYMPEDTVNIVDDGTVVDEIDGTGSSYDSSVSKEELPDGLNRRDRILIVQAVDKADSIDSIRKLHGRVKHALQAEGLDPLSYQSVLRKIDEYFKLDQEQTQDDVSVEDLPTEERKVIEAYGTVDNPMPASVADAAGVSKETVVRVLDNREELVRESMSGSTTEADVDKSENQTDTTAAEMSTVETEAPSPEESPIYQRADLTTAQQEIIEHIAQNPNATGEEVAEATGYSKSYPSRMRNNKNDVIRARAEELGKDLSEFEESNERRTRKLTAQWSELSGQQKGALRLLAEEADPLDPDKTLRQMADELEEREGYETYASYFIDTGENYGDFAVRLKNAKEVTESQEEAEQLVDSVPIDEELVVDGVSLDQPEAKSVEEEAVEEEAVEEEAVEEEAVEEEAVEEEAVEEETVEEETVEEETVEEEAVEKETVEEEVVEEEAVEKETVEQSRETADALQKSLEVLSNVRTQKRMTEAELNHLDDSREAASTARDKVLLESLEDGIEEIVAVLE